MKKQTYEELVYEVIEFTEKDIITGSCIEYDEGQG